MPTRLLPTTGTRGLRRVTGVALTAFLLVGAASLGLSGCTAGSGQGPGQAGGGTASATPVPTTPDPVAADVLTSGTALSVNGVAVHALTVPGTTAAPSPQPDGSVRIALEPSAAAGTAPTTGATPAGTADPGASSGPLAWLTGPVGSTVAVLEDGSAVISAAGGGFLVGLSAPVPNARFSVVGTPAAMLRVDRLAPDALASADPAAPVTTWLSGTAVVSAVWGVAEGGRSLEVTPSDWARTGTLAAQQALWSQLVAEQPEADSPSMHDQLLCHVLGAAGKTTWHIEPWRPQVDALTMLRTRCNPTQADVSAPATTPTAG